MWFTDYWKDRKQRVVLLSGSSRWTSIKAGVSKGAIVGPLLFRIYIYDIVQRINSSIGNFAYDTSLYIVVENPIQSSTLFNSNLNEIYEWASKWLVTFNPNKGKKDVKDQETIQSSTTSDLAYHMGK